MVADCVGGLSGVSGSICAVAMLFGGLDLDSLGEQLGFFVMFLVYAAGSFAILWLGIRLKNSGRRNMMTTLVTNSSLPAKKKMQRATNIKVWGKCEKCGESLRAFHYYRDNCCSTYCDNCGNSNQAVYAAPYRTIELSFSGIQCEGFSLTVEVEKWPSLEQCCLQWQEWNETGGIKVKVDLPANYMTEHTVEEFLEEYILKENDVTKHICFPVNEGLLRQIRDRLTESDVLQVKRTADTGKITVQDALNTFSEEEQWRFENRQYQYSQDTDRAGLSPEIAAANRGLVFVDGRPVAKEVAARLDEMRNAVFSDNAVDTGQTGQSQKKVRSGRPEGPISVICQLSDECNKDGAFYSFEQRTREVTLVKNQTHYFVCVSEYSCVAEANTRPVSSYTEFYYTVTVSNVDGITADNWKENVVRPAAYVYHRLSEGVV